MEDRRISLPDRNCPEMNRRFILYYNLLPGGKQNSYLADIDR